ncbi:hypothetical protein KAX08_04475 [candidate division WOR-3 bacterium]|nr:hypothetical protein [candidate division WOR-3 bacterium]
MKKIYFLFAVVLSLFAKDGYIIEYSHRIVAMDRDLSLIVKDSLTDMLYNPANLMVRNLLFLRYPYRIGVVSPFPFKMRFGAFLEGFYNKISSSENQSSSSRLYYDEFFSKRTYIEERKDENYKGVFLMAKDISPSTSLGIRYTYAINNFIKEREIEDTIYYEDNEDNLRIIKREGYDLYRDNIEDKISSHTIVLGVHTVFSNEINLECLLGFKKEEEHFIYENLDKDFYLYEDWRIYDGDSSYYKRRNVRDNFIDESVSSIPIIGNFGIRLFKESEKIRRVAVCSFSWGEGDEERERSKDRYRLDERYNSRWNDTTYSSGDTLTDSIYNLLSVKGDRNIFAISSALGEERKILPNLMVGYGIRLFYIRDESQLEGEKIEEDTTSIKVTYIDREAKVSFPIGFEYKPIKEIAIRIGGSIYGVYDFYKEKVGENYESRERIRGPYYRINSGLGFNIKDKLIIDVLAGDLTNIKNWKVELIYNF